MRFSLKNGTLLQESAKTMTQATERFERSCSMCNRMSSYFCSNCPIRAAYENNKHILARPIKTTCHIVNGRYVVEAFC